MLDKCEHGDYPESALKVLFNIFDSFAAVHRFLNFSPVRMLLQQAGALTL
ncbi:MAG: hypothetical protein KKC25_03530 [Proteobacteria bacterium]|nr:hypothetical protein [Pseudomonadota bacterium]